LLKVACSGPGASQTRNVSVTSPILYIRYYTTAPINHRDHPVTTVLSKSVSAAGFEICAFSFDNCGQNYKEKTETIIIIAIVIVSATAAIIVVVLVIIINVMTSVSSPQTSQGHLTDSRV